MYLVQFEQIIFNLNLILLKLLMNELANVSKVLNVFEGEGFRRVFVRTSFKFENRVLL